LAVVPGVAGREANRRRLACLPVNAAAVQKCTAVFLPPAAGFFAGFAVAGSG